MGPSQVSSHYHHHHHHHQYHHHHHHHHQQHHHPAQHYHHCNHTTHHLPGAILNLDVSDGECPCLLIFVIWQVSPYLCIVLKFFIESKLFDRVDGVFCLSRQKWKNSSTFYCSKVQFCFKVQTEAVSSFENSLKAELEKFLLCTTSRCIYAP